MDSSSAQSPELQILYQLLLERKLDFQAKFPEIVREHQEAIIAIEGATQVTYREESDTNVSVVQRAVKQTKERFNKHKLDRILAVTQDEIDDIFAKLGQQIESNATVFTKDEQLYLEQQISDIIGYPVTSELEISLPYTWGSAVSMPHAKRHPTDELSTHTSIHEAGIVKKRDTQGWLSPLAEMSAETIGQEEYRVYLPLMYLGLADQNSETVRQELKNKKILVINPISKKMAIAEIWLSAIPQLAKYNLGLSPELSRSLESWKPPSQGRVCFLFIDDQEKVVPLGPVQYEVQF